jgi:serine/threonine protein kinase/class 3 adenylate cyclase/sugar lactone lactonase YvrE
MVTQESFGSLVRRYRREAELTQEALAERAGISVRAVRDIELGSKHRPRPDTVHLLLAALEVPEEERADLLRAASRLPSTDLASDRLQQALVSRATQVLTILIADMRGYTAYTVEHGDEAAANIAAQFATTTGAVVERSGGTVLELRGDEAACIFASARQAVRAAVALQEHYQHERAEGQFPLGVGMALDAGEVVAVEGGYRGQALNLAARLCSLAGPGDVLVSEGLVHLARKVEGLAYLERGYEQLKGIVDPVRVIAVAAESEVVAQSIAEAEASARPPIGSFLGALPVGTLVGREEEMRQLTEMLESAASREGRLLLVTGERGVGKTRLVQEVSVAARDRGFLVATGRCYESQRGLPYYPFLEALSHLLRAAPPPVRAGAARRWPHLARILPEELGAVPTPAADPHEEQARLSRAVTGFVVACAEQAPVTLLLDDLQWADEKSLDLLAHLARNTRANAVLLLGTSADDRSPADDRLRTLRRELGRERLLERLTLRRLPPEATTQLISSLMAETVASPELVDLVQRRTRGRPFFIEEMVRALGGRYQLVSELGAGGMGRVFQAVDTRDDSPVAVKILFASSAAGIDALLRFQQEGAVLAALTHPNIVEVKGTFLEEHISCIIMELLDGISLAEVLRVQQPDLPRIKHLLAQVAAPLAYAHGRNIVHRDIKPDNIMILAGDTVKVTDFGIARVLGTGATLNTATGMGIGTPLYMAPEQIEGSHVDGRADIYALGAVLYQMVTGKPPFEGEDPITIGFKHLQEAPQSPTAVTADLPPDWEDLILRMLAKDPEDRPQTAREVEASIEALSTEPVSSRPHSLLGRARTPTPKPAPKEKTPIPQAARVGTPGSPARAAPRGSAVPAVLRALTRRVSPLARAAGAGVVALVVSAAIVLSLFSFGGGSGLAPPTGLAADANWSSSIKANTADTSIASTARGVTVSNAFPDGNTAATCFIQVTSGGGISGGGIQSRRYGSCAGISLAVTCSSASYNLSKDAPSGTGASLLINARPTWTGAYDQGTHPPCPNHPTGINDSLAAHLSGTSAGQGVIWLVGGDNAGHLIDPSSSQRSGCFEYIQPAGASLPQCVRTDYRKNLGSFYDEVAARGTSGDIVEVQGAGTFANADVTLQGVFLEALPSPPLFADDLRSPAGVSVDAQHNVYIADSGNNLVEELSAAGTPIRSWTHAGGRRFSSPRAVAVDGSGDIYVADQNNNRVVKLSPSGQLIAPWGSGASGPSSLNGPLALALDADGNLWVTDAGVTPLHEFSPAGQLIKQVQFAAGHARYPVYSGVAVDRHGHLALTQEIGGGVEEYAVSGLSSVYDNQPISTFGTYGGRRGEFRDPSSLAIDAQGTIYVADSYNNRIAVLSPSGAWLFAFGRKGDSAGAFNLPGGIAVDSQGNVYVADTSNHRVQKLVPRRTRT